MRLYRRYGAMVMRRCRQLLANDEAAADAMQETFLRVLRRRNSLHARYPSSLLYRIATNVCLNVLRSNRRRPTVSADPLLRWPCGTGKDGGQDPGLVRPGTGLLRSKEGTRKAAEMLYLEGRTLAETAVEVDLSISGVRKRMRTLREHEPSHSSAGHAGEEEHAESPGNHLCPRSSQELQGPARQGRPRTVEAVRGIDLSVTGGRDLRIPRAQRRGEEHDAAHPLHAPRRRRRAGDDRRLRRAHGARGRCGSRSGT